MKRWIQAFVLLASPLLAFDLVCDGDFEVGAEALYWKACFCDWQYGISQSIGFDNERIDNVRSVNTGYDWGFRIFGEYNPCDGCSFLALDWTYLRTTDSESDAAVRVGGANLNNNILAKLRTRYNRVNLRGGYFAHRSCNLDVYVYAGARWIDFDLRMDVSGNVGTTPAFVKERSELSGGAIEVGVGGLYRFDCGINLVTNFGPLAAIGKRKHSLSESGNVVEVGGEIAYPDRTICFLGLDFRVGLNTCFDCSCFTVTAEIGYEVNYYFNALTTIIAYRPSNNANLSVCRNIGFAGPYASLGLRF